ncbi:hypothetical protein U1Q18_047925 [Sarracenia purpurea var. burkii]
MARFVEGFKPIALANPLTAPPARPASEDMIVRGRRAVNVAKQKYEDLKKSNKLLKRGSRRVVCGLNTRMRSVLLIEQFLGEIGGVQGWISVAISNDRLHRNATCGVMEKVERKRSSAADTVKLQSNVMYSRTNNNAVVVRKYRAKCRISCSTRANKYRKNRSRTVEKLIRERKFYC